jgi:signal recognition particle receptor subunit beta
MKYKIIVAGPVGAGKTTAINSLTSENTFMTDVSVSDEVTSQRKANTTVAMDFGVVRLNDNDVAHVYGTPGQQRFNFMWEILSEGADGLILLFDNSRNYPFRDLKYFVESFSDLIASKTLTIAVTRSDVADETPLEAYQQWVKELNLDTTVTFIDAREKRDVEQIVYKLMERIVSSNQSSESKNTPFIVDSDFANSEIPEAASLETELALSLTTNVNNTATEKKELVLEDETALILKDFSEVIEEDVSKGVVKEETVVHTPTEVFHLDENIMEQVSTLKDVEGVTLTNSYGELLHSTINDDDTNEFIAFLSGIAPALEDASGLGTINRMMLRGPSDDNLTVFVEQEHSLGISSNKRVSVPALSQKIEDMLQWA